MLSGILAGRPPRATAGRTPRGGRQRDPEAVKYISNQIPSMNPTQITTNGVVAACVKDQNLTKADLSNVAVKCLTEIIRNSNALTLRSLLLYTFRYVTRSLQN